MEEEDLTSFWSHHQEVVDELKHELLYATIELESTRMEANEAARKSKAAIRELMEELDSARQERDEAKSQLQKLLNKIDMLPAASFSAAAGLPSNNIEAEPSPTSPDLQRQLNRANSSITDSTSLSHGGGVSSPVDSFFDTVSSPDFSAVNVSQMADNTNAHTSNLIMFAAGPSASLLVPEYHPAPEAGRNVMDQASLIIDGLSKGKPLPQKGRLLEAVMAAGPLLQTLLVAGPLPQWRNPPPPQPLKVVPPVPMAIKGCNVGGGGMLMNQKVMARGAVNPSPTYLAEMSSGGSSSSFNFANGLSSVTCLPGMPLLTSASSFNCQVRGSKRPKFQ